MYVPLGPTTLGISATWTCGAGKVGDTRTDLEYTQTPGGMEAHPTFGLVGTLRFQYGLVWSIAMAVLPLCIRLRTLQPSRQVRHLY